MHRKESLWKLVTSPTFEVVAAIVVMLIAAWVVIDSGVFHNAPDVPVLFGRK